MKSLTGLTDKQVTENRERYGHNIITPPKKVSPFILFLRSFKDPIIVVLLVAAAVSFAIAIFSNDYLETIGIICAIVLSTGIAFWFEYDANKKFELLNKIQDEEPYKVIRNGVICLVKKEDIVVGDYIILESGDEIPADGNLVKSNSLLINESCMTGELSVSKSEHPESADPEATFPTNRILRGTTILEGNCEYIVDKVGDATEYGKVAKQATEIIKDKTPLAKQLAKLANFVSVIAMIVSVLIFVSLTIQAWLHGVFDNGFFTLEVLQKLLQFFMVSVAILVVAVPEGLPMSITLSLALSMRKMLKANNLVRKMHACETMGATTVICTDKTGTLTQNRMVVKAEHIIDTADVATLYHCMAVNSTANLGDNDSNGVPTMLGNPTECALLLWLTGKDIDYKKLRNECQIIKQLPFNTERKYMATATTNGYILVKGAPEILLERSTNLSSEEHKNVENILSAYQGRAMRTLGFAYRKFDANEQITLQSEQINNLHFMGVVGIEDPIREEVPSAIKECHNAGIDIKIVTGDTAGTAREIARQTGIWNDKCTDANIITGTDFEALSDEEALKRIQAIKVMCRARPTDKQRLVSLLKNLGEVVAVTGDGTNDAPALNHADVGLSMGSGTSVAKESSDITLIDDSFRSIASAVMWGRSLYRNIQRFILFQLTINMTAMAIVVIGPFMGVEMPLTVTQMLWVNLIIDTFASMALASLPPSKLVMLDKPRNSKSFILVPEMLRSIALLGISFTAILLGMLYYMKSSGQEIDSYELCIFFTFFVFLQFWNLFNAKAFFTNRSAFANMKQSTGFVIALLIIGLGQFIIVQFGGNVFRTEPLSLTTWIAILATSSIPLIAGEAFRLIKKVANKQ